MNDITVIIPTYNVENYIEEAMLSIINQKFVGKIELIVIDDCSTDATVSKINSVINNYKTFNIRFLQQEQNMRQGTARNRGIKESNSKYLMFLDGDDFLDDAALQKMFDKAERGNCDFVLCDWAYYYTDKGVVYVNNEKFMNNDFLDGKAVEELLAAGSFFTVNKLYRRTFLVENNIYFGENYIYEDVEFYVDVAQKASRVGVIQNPFYKVRVNYTSTTKTNTASSEHVASFLKAIEATLQKFEPRKEISRYFLYRYLLTKALNYTKYRAPKKYRKNTIVNVVNKINETDFLVPKGLSPFYDIIFGRGLVQNYKYGAIIFFYNIHSNRYLNKLFLFAYKIKVQFWKFRQKVKLKVKNFRMRLLRKIYSKFEVNKKVILFLGFDYNYIGNSKYFFDYMVENHASDFKLYFVTNNKNVNDKYRVSPRSKEFYKLLGQAKVVIGESWIPLDFPKKDGQKWIQLWHGTPFKRMLFDSHEKFITKRNPSHKRNKFKDILRWDLLLSDSKIAYEKFQSSFAYDKHKILNVGYPRVQWLKENHENVDLKNEIKKILGIHSDKKVVLYVPTWRDYNFRNDKLDLDYVLDLKKLQELLGERYTIINKNHALANNVIDSSEIIVPPKSIETQSLLLIADMVISDYSSIIFDAIAIRKPFTLYINDFEKYDEARGLYTDMYEDLSPYIVKDINDLVEKVKHPLLVDDLEFVEKYSSIYWNDPNKEIYKKIKEMTLN